ncbi:hypothetical protein CLOP_g8497 [Closterium sp. NIES-67]|nr:hypothetical protein CLOP_g8497 [Closterium sp. NIES-67]
MAKASLAALRRQSPVARRCRSVPSLVAVTLALLPLLLHLSSAARLSATDTAHLVSVSRVIATAHSGNAAGIPDDSPLSVSEVPGRPAARALKVKKKKKKTAKAAIAEEEEGSAEEAARAAADDAVGEDVVRDEGDEERAGVVKSKTKGKKSKKSKESQKESELERGEEGGEEGEGEGVAGKVGRAGRKSGKGGTGERGGGLSPVDKALAEAEAILAGKGEDGEGEDGEGGVERARKVKRKKSEGRDEGRGEEGSGEEEEDADGVGTPKLSKSKSAKSIKSSKARKSEGAEEDTGEAGEEQEVGDGETDGEADEEAVSQKTSKKKRKKAQREAPEGEEGVASVARGTAGGVEKEGGQEGADRNAASAAEAARSDKAVHGEATGGEGEGRAGGGGAQGAAAGGGAAGGEEVTVAFTGPQDVMDVPVDEEMVTVDLSDVPPDPDPPKDAAADGVADGADGAADGAADAAAGNVLRGGAEEMDAGADIGRESSNWGSGRAAAGGDGEQGWGFLPRWLTGSVSAALEPILAPLYPFTSLFLSPSQTLLLASALALLACCCCCLCCCHSLARLAGGRGAAGAGAGGSSSSWFGGRHGSVAAYSGVPQKEVDLSEAFGQQAKGGGAGVRGGVKKGGKLVVSKGAGTAGKEGWKS